MECWSGWVFSAKWLGEKLHEASRFELALLHTIFSAASSESRNGLDLAAAYDDFNAQERSRGEGINGVWKDDMTLRCEWTDISDRLCKYIIEC